MLELDLSVFPELRTERLLLRELRSSDADALHAMRRDEEVMQYIGRTRSSKVEDALALLQRIKMDRASNEGISWGIALAEEDALVGTIGLYRLKKEHYRAEVGYMLSPAHWGKGIMSEAIQAVLKCVFKDLGFNSIEADTDPANERSRKLLERNGFKLEGSFRESFYFDGKFYDATVFAILASDVLHS